MIYKGTFTAHFLEEDKKESFGSLDDAMKAAETYVGNNSYSRPFKSSETYLYGRGDGTTSVIIHADVEFEGE